MISNKAIIGGTEHRSRLFPSDLVMAEIAKKILFGNKTAWCQLI